jgi:histidyl-tRNA synthetase
MNPPEARLYKGVRDIFSSDLIAKQQMLDKIRIVYERYGFVPLETPSIEYADVLGKFLPGSDTPEGGIFAFENPDLKDSKEPKEEDKWIAFRYELTASLARVAAQYRELQSPFRRYQVGNVWRVEKPGPGRFREFCQFDSDTVGSSSMLADVEACTVVCESLEAIGFTTGDYLVKINNRKITQGLLKKIGLESVDLKEDSSQALITLRSIDKLERLGIEGVKELLRQGRQDRSGDFTQGAGLNIQQIDKIVEYLSFKADNRKQFCDRMEELFGNVPGALEGINELREIDKFLSELGFTEEKVIFDSTIVRGLGYYTGPVYECILTMPIVDERGNATQFGSIFGGGRYDNLVERFTGQKIPATGGSIGVDRLLEAVKMLGRIETRKGTADVIVTVMDESRIADYIRLVQVLRQEGINTEIYLGEGRFGKQLGYADMLDIPLAIIAGSDEFEKGEFLIKDLKAGRELASKITDRKEWKKAESTVQYSVKADEIVSKIKEFLGK